MKKKKINLPVKTILFTTTILLVSVFIVAYAWGVFASSNYFKVKEVFGKEGLIPELSYLTGRNIFSIDLRNESRYILDYYPDSRSIRLVRILPNRIFVDFIKRRPVALIKLYRNFSVDKEGVIFYLGAQGQEPDLPIILGLETKIFGPKPGRRYNIRELNLALSILREIARNRQARLHKITKIDVANAANASVVMGKDSYMLEVKLGPDNIRDKINFLSSLITQNNSELKNIKYIDLRFKEPVIKLNSQKSP